MKSARYGSNGPRRPNQMHEVARVDFPRARYCEERHASNEQQSKRNSLDPRTCLSNYFHWNTGYWTDLPLLQEMRPLMFVQR